ncbi:MAG: hypothetical protein ACTSWN_13495 [Promethearchaeota archaeon]
MEKEDHPSIKDINILSRFDEIKDELDWLIKHGIAVIKYNTDSYEYTFEWVTNSDGSIGYEYDFELGSAVAKHDRDKTVQYLENAGFEVKIFEPKNRKIPMGGRNTGKPRVKVNSIIYNFEAIRKELK